FYRNLPAIGGLPAIVDRAPEIRLGHLPDLPLFVMRLQADGIRHAAGDLIDEDLVPHVLQAKKTTIAPVVDDLAGLLFAKCRRALVRGHCSGPSSACCGNSRMRFSSPFTVTGEPGRRRATPREYLLRRTPSQQGFCSRGRDRERRCQSYG